MADKEEKSKALKSLDDYLKDVHPDKIRDISGKHEEAHDFAYQRITKDLGKINFDKTEDDKLLDLLSEYMIGYEHKKGIIHEDHLDKGKRSDEFKVHYKEKVKELINNAYQEQGGLEGALKEIRSSKGFSKTFQSLHENMKSQRIQTHAINAYDKHVKKLDAKEHLEIAGEFQKINPAYKSHDKGDIVKNLNQSLVRHALQEYGHHQYKHKK